MLASIVVPTYRRPLLLSRCLDALLRQSFPKEKYEIIVVSDGRDPVTAEVVTALSSVNTVYMALAEKRGPAAARNIGWRNAKGKLIAFTDDDCIPDSGWLQNLWNHFERSTDVVALTGKLVVPVSDRPTDYEKNIRHLESAEFITANCACSAKALEITGGFDENFSMAWREDSDLHFNLIACNVPIERVNAAVVIHPVRQARWGVSIKEQRKSMFNALLYKKYPKLYRERIQRHPVWNYYFIVLSFVLMLINLIEGNSMTAFAFGVIWILLTALFTMKRLRGASRTSSHIVEMGLTSLVIPFLSVYWRLYGSWKFKTAFF